MMYKIGDEVWYRFVGKSIKSKVVEVNEKTGLYRCTFYATTATFRENELYPTKEELLNSLKL
jgi:uncharacterized protein YodC (DUF2158 family)